MLIKYGLILTVSNNGVDVGQGCKFLYASSTECSRDTHEDAGHEMEINITGDSNAYSWWTESRNC